MSSLSPSITASALVAPQATSALLSAQAPTAIMGAIFSFPAISISSSPEAPIVTTSALVTPSAISISSSPLSPTAITGTLVGLQSISALLSAQAPFVPQSASVTPSAISISLFPSAPTITGDATVISPLEILELEKGMLVAGWYDCDECSFTFRKSRLMERYDGALVCKYCFETRHPREVLV